MTAIRPVLQVKHAIRKLATPPGWRGCRQKNVYGETELMVGPLDAQASIFSNCLRKSLMRSMFFCTCVRWALANVRVPA